MWLLLLLPVHMVCRNELFFMFHHREKKTEDRRSSGPLAGAHLVVHDDGFGPTQQQSRCVRAASFRPRFLPPSPPSFLASRGPTTTSQKFLLHGPITTKNRYRCPLPALVVASTDRGSFAAITS